MRKILRGSFFPFLPQKNREQQKNKLSNMKKTIIVGTIEFLNRRVVIHSIDELYRANSKEELEALEETFDNEVVDYLVVEEYMGEIVVTNECLVDLLEDNWGNKPTLKEEI